MHLRIACVSFLKAHNNYSQYSKIRPKLKAVEVRSVYSAQLWSKLK